MVGSFDYKAFSAFVNKSVKQARESCKRYWNFLPENVESNSLFLSLAGNCIQKVSFCNSTPPCIRWHWNVPKQNNYKNLATWQASFKIMCRTLECYVKVRLCFSGGSHNPVDMATFTSSILSAMFTRVCGKPEKLSLALVPCSYILCMIVKLTPWKLWQIRMTN